jgi:hypothetical protein
MRIKTSDTLTFAIKKFITVFTKQQASKLIHQQALFTNTHVRNPKKPYLTAIKSHPT